MHIVKSGDWLSKIAITYYGDYKNDEYEHVNAETKTDNNGRFRFSNLKKDRNYRLLVHDCTTTNKMGVEITGGATEELTAEVDLFEWSQLKPGKPDETE